MRQEGAQRAQRRHGNSAACPAQAPLHASAPRINKECSPSQRCCQLAAAAGFAGATPAELRAPGWWPHRVDVERGAVDAARGVLVVAAVVAAVVARVVHQRRRVVWHDRVDGLGPGGAARQRQSVRGTRHVTRPAAACARSAAVQPGSAARPLPPTLRTRGCAGGSPTRWAGTQGSPSCW